MPECLNGGHKLRADGSVPCTIYSPLFCLLEWVPGLIIIHGILKSSMNQEIYVWFC